MRSAPLLALLLAACAGAPPPAPPAAAPPPAKAIALAPAAPPTVVADAAAAPACRAAATLFRSLKERVRITVYASRGLPALDAYVDRLEKLLAGYQQIGRAHV